MQLVEITSVDIHSQQVKLIFSKRQFSGGVVKRSIFLANICTLFTPIRILTRAQLQQTYLILNIKYKMSHSLAWFLVT